MANDFELRLKGLEDREAILYSFIDELREEHKDSRKRIAQNEEVTATVVQSLGLILRILERMDQKLDDLGKPSRNGDS